MPGIASTVTLIAAPNPATAFAPITFTATVTATHGNSPSGSVQFYDDAAPLGDPLPLDAQGHATYVTTALAAGTHPITAIYSGSSNLLASTSPVFNQSVAPAAASVYTGEQLSTHVAVVATDGFNQPLTLSCSGLPANATCTFAQAVLQNGAGLTTLVIHTAAPQRAYRHSFLRRGRVRLSLQPQEIAPSRNALL